MTETLSLEPEQTFKILDLRSLSHDRALQQVRQSLSSVNKPFCVVDVDGPLIPMEKFRIFSVGQLPKESQEFLSWLIKNSFPFVIFTSRPLEGRLALYLNEEGAGLRRITGAIRSSTFSTTLFNQLQHLTVKSDQIIYPKNIRSLFFPLFKIEELTKILLHQAGRLHSCILSDHQVHYLGDTHTDFQIFQRLIRSQNNNNLTSGIYYRFPQAYPLGIC